TGHGKFQYRGRTVGANIAACHIFGKPVLTGNASDGSEIVPYMTCGIPCCVNYEHVEFCSRKEMTVKFWRPSPFARNAKKETCSKGHPFTEDNTCWDYRIYYKAGLTRVCLECRRKRNPGTQLRPTTQAEARAKRVRDLTALAFELTKSISLEIRS